MMIRIFVLPTLQKMFNKNFFFFKLFTTSRTNIHYNYLILIMAGDRRLELLTTVSKTAVLPLHQSPIYTRHIFSIVLPIVLFSKLAGKIGLEPITHRLCNLLYMSCAHTLNLTLVWCRTPLGIYIVRFPSGAG